MAIQMRRGNAENFDPTKLRAGEFAVSQDNSKIYICISQGNVVEVATGTVIEEWINEAEAWAIGERSGVPVPSTDPTYQNNSKYYSDRAEAANLNPPYIGTNGNWFVYSTAQEQYVDSGVDASITVTIADVTMLSYGATPYVTNTGTSTDPIFHLFIPAARSVSSVAKTGTSGLVDTYTITYSDNTTSTFTVTNGEDGEDGADGRGIVNVRLTASVGLTDTYTITYTDGVNPDQFTVRNGNAWFSGTGISGKSATPTVYPNSGVSKANLMDCFLNTNEGAIYQCTHDGIPSTAEWVYLLTLTGGSGTGDMEKTVYDNDNAVANAGGIADYTTEILRDAEVIEGKNLLEIKESSYTSNGITFTYIDGVVKANGTSSGTSGWIIPITLKKGKYVFSGTNGQSGSDDNHYYTRLRKNGTKPTSSEANPVTIESVNGSETAFEVLQDNLALTYEIMIYAAAGAVSNLTFYPMIREESESADYEPYYIPLKDSKFDRAEQNILGAKNWFNTSVVTVGASLITINDASIKIKNTTAGAWQNGGFRMPVQPNTNYTFTADVDFISGEGAVSIRDRQESGFTVLASLDEITADRKAELTFNTQNYSSIVIVLFCTGGTSTTGEVDYNNCMLRLASDTDDTYEPYAMTNKQLTDAFQNYIETSTYTDSSGTRTFAFSDARITTTGRYDYYCNVYGVVPTSVSVSSGSMNVNFNTSDSVTNCGVEIKGGA